MYTLISAHLTDNPHISRLLIFWAMTVEWRQGSRQEGSEVNGQKMMVSKMHAQKRSAHSLGGHAAASVMNLVQLSSEEEETYTKNSILYMYMQVCSW